MRALRELEMPLVAYLFGRARLGIDLATLRVESMEDGGMGSMRIGPIDPARRFGSAVSDCWFSDCDGVTVSAQLNVDQHGAPYEVDIWRVDFGSLQHWPEASELRVDSQSRGRNAG